MKAETPARSASSGPSANGKKASEASTESASPCPCSRAFSSEIRTESTAAVFVFIGADAETSWLPGTVIRDARGYVCTGRDVTDLVAESNGRWALARDPYLLETSVPGVFAAGDVRHGSIKRVAAGVGEGSMTIAFVHQYLA